MELILQYLERIRLQQFVTIDVKYSGDVFFENQTLVFFVKNPPWIPGVTYYVAFSQGVGTADMSCGLEDGGFGKEVL